MAEPQYSTAALRHPLIKAWEHVAHLHEVNALHYKRGVRQQDWTKEEFIEHLKEEIQELSDSPSDIKEMADVGILWMKVVQLSGYNIGQIGEAMLFKMNHHFGDQ